MMQVIELRDPAGVIPRLGMGGDIVDLFVADPDVTPVIEGIEILLPGP
jgi:hypothetical protein